MGRFKVTVTTEKDSAAQSKAAIQTICSAGPQLVKPAPAKSDR
jgi:hypothetical protein